MGVLAALVAVPAPASGTSTEGACRAPQARSITYIGVTRDQSDFANAGVGRSGSWFPQFAAATPVTQRPTGENARSALPGWIAPLSNFPQDPDFEARTFSQDGPARSAGGGTGWAVVTLPDGEVGRSGAIVDPATAGNSNNTINRIVLRGNVPATFYLHVVTDNTDGEFDPTDLIRARGNIGSVDREDTQVEADTGPEGIDLAFNGTPDQYTFRFDGFEAGDYLKLRLKGAPAPAGGASFGGLLFDETFVGDLAPPAPPCSEPEPVGPSSTTPTPPPSRTGTPLAGSAAPVAADPTYTG